MDDFFAFAINFVCPFCGRFVHAVNDNDPRVYHQKPICDRFDALELDEYMVACNQALRREYKLSRR